MSKRPTLRLPGQAPKISKPTPGPTSAATPLPRLGDILNYVFLFAREASAGRDEGVKARPVMVMAVTGRRVTVMPLTTKGEDNPSTSIAIPAEVAKAMGLRGEARSSLVPGELNAFEWTGHDLRQHDRSGSFVFGRCPPRFFQIALDASLGARPISRD